MAKAKGLYKRGHIWWIRYAGPDGKIRFESSKSSASKDAQALLIQRKKEVMEGQVPRVVKQLPRYSFAELATYYASWAARQRAFYTSKKFLIPQLQTFFGACQLRSMTTRLVEEYQTKLPDPGEIACHHQSPPRDFETHVYQGC